MPLPRVVGFALAKHLEQFPAGDDGRIFRQADGGDWRRNRFAEIWHRSRLDPATAIERGERPASDVGHLP